MSLGKLGDPSPRRQVTGVVGCVSVCPCSSTHWLLWSTSRNSIATFCVCVYMHFMCRLQSQERMKSKRMTDALSLMEDILSAEPPSLHASTRHPSTPRHRKRTPRPQHYSPTSRQPARRGKGVHTSESVLLHPNARYGIKCTICKCTSCMSFSKCVCHAFFTIMYTLQIILLSQPWDTALVQRVWPHRNRWGWHTSWSDTCTLHINQHTTSSLHSIYMYMYTCTTGTAIIIPGKGQQCYVYY